MVKLNSRNKTFFYLLLLFTGYVAYTLLRPYLGVVVFSMVVVIVFRPLYRRYLQWFKRRQGPAIALTLVTISVVILIPTALVVQITADQALDLYRNVVTLQADQMTVLSRVVNEVNELLKRLPFEHGYKLTEQEIVQFLKRAVTPAGSFLASHAVEVGASTVDIITTFIIFVSLVATLLPAWPKVIQFLKELSPLDDELDQKYIDRVTAMTHSMVRGVFVVAITQGLVMGLLLWIAGVRYIAFWTLLAIFLSILPVGASLVAFPVGGYLILTGDLWQGAVVILGYMFVVSNIDSLLRARLAPQEAQLSPVLVLLSLFGGLKLFGFMGVIYGPVVMIFLMTTIEIYLEHYRVSVHAEPLPDCPEPPAPPEKE